MLQRPQTLLFLGAALLTALIAFSPLCSYSPPFKDNPANTRLVVSASNVDLAADYSSDAPMSEEEFDAQLAAFNDELDEELEKRNLSVILTVGLMGMLLLAALIVVLAFMFKNRKLQIRMGAFLMILTVVTTLGVYIGSRVALRVFGELDILSKRLADYDWEISYQYGFFLLPVVIVLLLVGIIMVRRDDNLIKSIDRIR